MKVVIFGNGGIAELAHYYFTHDSDYEVVAFTADAEYVESDSFCGLPVVPFHNVVSEFSPSQYKFFVALSYARMNRVRAVKFAAAKDLGYDCVSYIHSKAICASNVGVGKNCFVLENVVIQPFAEIGDNVTIWSGSHIGHHSKIKDNCFITSHVVVSGGVTVGRYSFLGVNATVRDHVEIGEHSLIGAGALILESTISQGVYVGAPSTLAKVPSSKVRSI